MTTPQYESYLPSYIDNKIDALVGGAPSNLNTIAKLAVAIGNDTSFNSNIQTQLNGKQNIIADGGLSISKIAGLDTQLQTKYSKSEVDALLAGKQSVLTDSSISISKIINLQNELNDKANLISPTFLGAPTAPTTGINNNSQQIATTEFVNDKIDELINDVLEDMQTDINTRATTTQ